MALSMLKARRTMALGIAGGLAFTVAAVAPADAKSKTPAKNHKVALPTPHIGQTAKDGDFAFRVTAVQCGVTTLGQSPLSENAPAGAQWCLVSMTVKDDKSGSQTFSDSNQYAYDSKGNKLSADDGALLYVPNGVSGAFTTVNPGVSIAVTVPFQMAASDKIKKFELHDSAFSGGVTVYNVG